MSRKKGEKHWQAFVMAGVEFQKYQCYYAGAIQIAAQVVSQQQPANRCSTGTRPPGLNASQYHLDEWICPRGFYIKAHHHLWEAIMVPDLPTNYGPWAISRDLSLFLALVTGLYLLIRWKHHRIYIWRHL